MVKGQRVSIRNDAQWLDLEEEKYRGQEVEIIHVYEDEDWSIAGSHISQVLVKTEDGTEIVLLPRDVNEY